MSKELVIVTGAAYEEGLSVAEGLLRAGYLVSLWDHEEELLEKAETELAGLGFEADYRAVDVADPGAVQATYEAVRSAQAVPAALFNMATLKNTFMHGEPEQRPSGPTPFWTFDREKIRRTVEVNVLGTIFCTAAVSPDMVEAKRGSIVTFTTGPDTQRSAEHIPYGPSKAMVEAFTAAAATELEPHGVRVNAIASSGRVNRRGQSDPKYVPSDWAFALVAYLAGPESAGITGKVFRGGSVEPNPL